jgi:hypothetical protein
MVEIIEMEGEQFCAEMKSGIQGCIDQIAREAVAACGAGPSLRTTVNAMHDFAARYKEYRPAVTLSVRNRPVAPMERVAEYILGEMMKNQSSPAVSSLKMLTASLWPGDRRKAYDDWKNLVGSRQPWDHKKTILASFMDWSYDVSIQHLFAYDLWSNMHYGYVGLAAGFTEVELRGGAAVASVQGNGLRFLISQGSLDDIRDTAAIEIGMELWRTYGPDLDLEGILFAVRRDVTALNTYFCGCSPCL